MTTLDLRHVGKLFIQVLSNKPWPFEMVGGITCPNLTGATATMIISQSATIQTLTVGAGLTITGVNKIAVNATALPEGVYSYSFEIIPITGDVIRIIHQIHATNE